METVKPCFYQTYEKPNKHKQAVPRYVSQERERDDIPQELYADKQLRKTNKAGKYKPYI